MTIAALETALNDSKLEYLREIERLNMIIADKESQDLNNDMQFEEIEDILKNKPRLTNLGDALQRVS